MSTDHRGKRKLLDDSTSLIENAVSLQDQGVAKFTGFALFRRATKNSQKPSTTSVPTTQKLQPAPAPKAKQESTKKPPAVAKRPDSIGATTISKQVQSKKSEGNDTPKTNQAQKPSSNQKSNKVGNTGNVNRSQGKTKALGVKPGIAKPQGASTKESKSKNPAGSGRKLSQPKQSNDKPAERQISRTITLNKSKKLPNTGGKGIPTARSKNPGKKPTNNRAAVDKVRSNAKSKAPFSRGDVADAKNKQNQAGNKKGGKLCKRGAAGSCLRNEETEMTNQGSGSNQSPLMVAMSSDALRDHGRTTSRYIQDNKMSFALDLLKQSAPVIGGAAACTGICCTGHACGLPAAAVAASVLGGSAVTAGCVGGVGPECWKGYKSYKAGEKAKAEDERRKTREQLGSLTDRVGSVERNLGDIGPTIDNTRATANTALEGVERLEGNALVLPPLQHTMPSRSNEIPTEMSSRPTERSSRGGRGRGRATQGRA